MSKWCFNYDSGEYEYIDKDGFSIDRGEYVYNWDDANIAARKKQKRESVLTTMKTIGRTDHILSYAVTSREDVYHPPQF